MSTDVDFPAPRVEHRPDGVTIVNDSDAPDADVLAAVQEFMTDTHFIESAGLTAPPSTFQLYAGGGDGNVLSRRNWHAPTNVIDEVKLARDLIDTDDTCSGTLGELLAAAFKGRMRHLHEDEKTEVLFSELGKKTRLAGVLREMYRELLIASSVTTVTGFTSEELTFSLDGVDRRINQTVIGPRVGVMPAENVRIKGSDIMGMGALCYKPSSWEEEQFLERFFSDQTTEPEKRVMRQQNPFLTTLLVGRVEEDPDTLGPFAATLGEAGLRWIYLFNPSMVHRTCFPKGAAKYPRPLLTGNFALLEAKRLLNIMDYALLQGGSNYIVVAKKGTDQRPGKPNEIAQLAKTVRSAGKTGVIVGDHRLSIEIITPNLEALLDPEKRDMIDRKLALRLLRVSDLASGSDSAEGSKNSMEFLQAVITTDREMLIRHVEDFIYDEVVKRNGRAFPKGAADIWMPPVILAGLDVFLQGILKLRDRGDIPRAYGVEFFGYDMKAAVRERRREAARGDDDVMVAPIVPHDAARPGGQPDRPDNGGGRPRGARDSPGAPRQTGEPIRAILNDETGDVIRVGELTYAILEQHVATKKTGRITTNERALLDAGGGAKAGVQVVEVNPEYACSSEKIVRLREGVGMIVGRRKVDQALVARALVFTTPEFSDLDVRETALRWGFELPEPQPDPAPAS